MLKTRIGDKVELKATRHVGRRGVVERIDGKDKVAVRLDGSQKIVLVAADQVRNYSLAARKAWKKMPVRKVGRPAGTRKYDRVALIVRLDRDLWDQLQALEAAGAIKNRTTMLNMWLREGLTKFKEESCKPCRIR